LQWCGNESGAGVKWRYFVGACLVGAWTMLWMGAPLFTVLAGIAFAAAWNAFKKRGQKAYEKN
jgi:hypothetical protein